MNKRIAIITLNWQDYAKKYLAEYIDSIKKQDYAGEMKIFITDNESTEESYEYVRNILMEQNTNNFEIIRNKNNDGFAKGNNDCIKLAMAQGFDYIILFNIDMVVKSECVSKMVEAVEIQPTQVGAVQARIMLWQEKEKINSLGNVTHFLGFGYASGYREEYVRLPSRHEHEASRNDDEICYPSGAAVLFTRQVLEKVGLFDEEFWMYNEDQDLGWRIWLAGFSCVLARQAVVYHKYEFCRSIKKYYWMDRNRIVVILKNYRFATLLLIAPAFLVMEIGLILFALKGGWFKEKINVYKYFLKLKNWRHIMSERKKIQSARILSDKNIIKLFSGKIWYQEIGDARLKAANMIFNVYWKIIKVLIVW
ncbi:glycosyltransferase family 2 protein [Patescibacteria group bacterium]|nr:glycosyltransferase family 2 protein [Patescibacteria group bacterium]MBU1663698.1 glycosyltransferase family 2 protein [Patescibacteria group bacterium]MBU2233350.1 glycosyltransferase family 2 protein [Patescibacteria group bacterium]MBU2264159.1 glycosyltransferase family 2 protein [Patescibacteria group bacterium]